MIRQILISAVVPVVSTLVILLASYVLGWMARSRRPEAWGVSVAFGLSFFVTFCLINGAIPDFPPGTSVNWIPYIALATIGLGIFEVEASVPEWVRWGGRFVLSGLALYGALSPMTHNYSGTVLLAGLFVVLGVMLVTWWGFDRFVQEEDQYMVPGLYLICSTVASGLLLEVMNYASLAQGAGALSAICGVLLLYFFFRPSREAFRGFLSGVLLLFAVILLSGWYFSPASGAETWPFLLLLVVPNAIWVMRLPVVGNNPGWLQRGAVGMIAVLVGAAGVALSVLFLQGGGNGSGSPYDQGEEEEEYDDYGY